MSRYSIRQIPRLKPSSDRGFFTGPYILSDVRNSSGSQSNNVADFSIIMWTLMIKSLNLANHGLSKSQRSLSAAPFFSLLFFGGQRKVTKETRPAIADSSLKPDGFRGAGKNSLNAVECRYCCSDIACRARRVHWL